MSCVWIPIEPWNSWGALTILNLPGQREVHEEKTRSRAVCLARRALQSCRSGVTDNHWVDRSFGGSFREIWSVVHGRAGFGVSHSARCSLSAFPHRRRSIDRSSDRCVRAGGRFLQNQRRLDPLYFISQDCGIGTAKKASTIQWTTFPSYISRICGCRNHVMLDWVLQSGIYEFQCIPWLWLASCSRAEYIKPARSSGKVLDFRGLLRVQELDFYPVPSTKAKWNKPNWLMHLIERAVWGWAL